ncbi:hypothetical protein [Candidatus Poriferisodalis sp.]|uniref:hypothetical protein n=1 Tax=Candidatus Poriferisodalis sp. TaxID=3101277 RepID=UPI003B5B4A83
MYESIITSAREVRAVFNAFILPRIESGEILRLPLPATHAGASSGQPPGTRSQTLYYLDDRGIVAKAHCFLLPYGEIGASGVPDPKAVLFEGQWLVAETEQAVPD